MKIQVRGAIEHNLKDIDIEFRDGLTVVTGVSGSGKTSLVFDTVYHEARRRFLDIFSPSSDTLRMSPAAVRSITGLGPAIAVGQNLLNRNPNSTLATASGLHPFLRLLYTNFGERYCPRCDTPLEMLTEDEIVEQVLALAHEGAVTVCAPLVHRAPGSHRTLLDLLVGEFGGEALLVDDRPYTGQALPPDTSHDIQVIMARFEGEITTDETREAVQTLAELGAHAVYVKRGDENFAFARVPVCMECGYWFGDLKPTHFNRRCPRCQGEGCEECGGTGMHPRAASVRWKGLRFADVLALPVEAAYILFSEEERPVTGARLFDEIIRRLEALRTAGLGYINLDRSAPTLSRGESQRVRLSVALISRLEDMLYVLDEPTIGQHPADMGRLLKTFRQLKGSVIFVEHDRMAAAEADRAIDLGPGAGKNGGEVLFDGTPAGLWDADTPTGRYFSLRERVPIPEKQPAPEAFLTVRGADLRNLRHIDVPLPLGRLTVVTGVSGSGKSTFVEDVLVASLKQGESVGCRALEGTYIRPVWVDQNPIGRNPRSNPATYTKLADIIRDHYAAETGLSSSHFSFNRPEGACPVCNGIGAIEVKMRYLPSTWIPCEACRGDRFKDEMLELRVAFGDQKLSIADFFRLSIAEALDLFTNNLETLPEEDRQTAIRILNALCDVGLGYLPLGQPSPTLSGGEAQRVKLAKHLGRPSLAEYMLVLDEPTTGLHPQDLAGLLAVLNRLVKAGATIVVVEHNVDAIRAADWIIDLGPGAGPEGGKLLYAGPPQGLTEISESITGQALKKEATIYARSERAVSITNGQDQIVVRDAHAHNLKGVDVTFPKKALTVVTGVSGSGKSSLVNDVLEAEARRRFLETLSLYERQSIHEGPEADVGSVSGLGVSVSITPTRVLYNRRATVGSATEIAYHLAVLFAVMGQRACLVCETPMERGKVWICPQCGMIATIAGPRQFSPMTYAAACPECNGVGSLQTPAPEKLIVNPEKPLCAGAMYSPGFFPQGYLGKPYNGGYYMVRALAERYDFDPETTPWNEMDEAAQKVFLFGGDEILEVRYENRKGETSVRQQAFPGFYGWIRDWDVGGTYTDTKVCPVCNGARLRPEHLAVTIAGHNIHELSQMSLSRLLTTLESVDMTAFESHPATDNMHTVRRRLRFLCQVGLGYLNLDQVTATLSAGEAQRVKLAGLLGSDLTALTVLLDEPTRGMHPSEAEALLSALTKVRDDGNTVIMVEHDPLFMRAADHLIDLGPGSGVRGGEIVAQSTPEVFLNAATVTAQWLRGERKIEVPASRREPRKWMTIRGARANNLRGDEVRVPLGVLTGICGVSGSGKSTLMLDTVGRALVPQKQTTSVAYEPVDPGEHDEITGAPRRVVLLDQARAGVTNPMSFLKLDRMLLKLYAESEDAQALGLDAKALAQRCSACKGRGSTRIEMGFLPDEYVPCEVCQGTGYRPEAWKVRLRDIPLPEINRLTVDEVYERFGDIEAVGGLLQTVRDVGLGYLVMRQSGYTLSSGEAQRLNIANELSCRTTRKTLYILDEPTVGQSLEDIKQLIGVLQRLVGDKHSVIVIEHHPHVLAVCDWLIELGPGGGPDGGRVVAQGTPEDVASGSTLTAPYLREILEVTR